MYGEGTAQWHPDPLEYRKHAVGSQTVYYRIAGDDVIGVVRILHTRMDVDRHLD